MKAKLCVFLIFTIILFGCQTNENSSYKSVVFSNATFHYEYSLKINTSDTIYIEVRNNNSRERFFTLLEEKEKDSIEIFIKNLDFDNYKFEYIDDDFQNEEAYKMYVVNDSRVDSIIVFGNKAPKEFCKFANWIENLKSKHKLSKFNHKIDFDSLNYKMVAPPPPPPPAPKIEEVIKK